MNWADSTGASTVSVQAVCSASQSHAAISSLDITSGFSRWTMPATAITGTNTLVSAVNATMTPVTSPRRLARTLGHTICSRLSAASSTSGTWKPVMKRLCKANGK